jgi:signal transduction histidine kinase
MDEASSDRALGEAGFRREAAHALSTPLGGLLLQAELADHYLRKGKATLAQEALGTLLRDFDAFGQRFRSVFSAMADIAEDGGSGSDPRGCLAEALVELGEESVEVGYRGPSPRVAVPPRALCALMRRLAMLATASGAGGTELVVTTAGNECILSLTGAGASAGDHNLRFDSPGDLHYCVAREIAARHGGRLSAGGGAGAIVLVILPMAAEAAGATG